ncbi:MAG: GH3 auxin-responsive promoter family protein, partial [Deltaproteobacteria bacterium]|nr:GH3 auxin-responsive promoter family protein [Deltaproteobacteria bacterium]
MSLTQRALHLAYLAGMRSSYRQLAAGARDVRGAQDARLRHILARHAGSAYGRAWGLEALLAAPTAEARREGLRARAPLVTYDDLAPWVARVAAGEGDVLSCGPLKMLERSGGSTATNKLIPYNADLLAEFGAATNAWLYDLYRHRPALWGTKSYWSVSPAARAREVTAGGLPIGLEDDTEYFSPALRWALSRLLAAPGSLARAPDFETWRRETLRCLLEAEDLGLISVWNPTFLTLLMDHLVAHFDELARAVSPRRQRALARAAAGGGGFSARRVWPRLGLISCWGDGAAAGFLPALQARFPGVEVQPKGVLATEGALTAPLTGVGAALCVTSHFYEFLPVRADGQVGAG